MLSHTELRSPCNKLKINTAQKMKFSIKDFFSKYDQIGSDLVTFTKESLMENLIFCVVKTKTE